MRICLLRLSGIEVGARRQLRRRWWVGKGVLGESPLRDLELDETPASMRCQPSRAIFYCFDCYPNITNPFTTSAVTATDAASPITTPQTVTVVSAHAVKSIPPF